MGIEIGALLTYAGIIVLIFLVGKVFLWPLKFVLKLVISSLIGGIIIFLINAIGLLIIPLNILTAVIVGVLGVPGVILLIILSLL